MSYSFAMQPALGATQATSFASGVVAKYSSKIGYMGLNKAGDALTANILDGGGSPTEVQGVAKTVGEQAGATICAPYGPLAAKACSIGGGIVGGILGGLFGSAGAPVEWWHGPGMWASYFVPRIREAQLGIAAVRRYLTIRDQLLDDCAAILASAKMSRDKAHEWANQWLGSRGFPAAPIHPHWKPRSELWNTWVQFETWANGQIVTFAPFLTDHNGKRYGDLTTSVYKRKVPSSRDCAIKLAGAPGIKESQTQCDGYKWIPERFTASGAVTPTTPQAKGWRVDTKGFGQCVLAERLGTSCPQVLANWYYPNGIPAHTDSAIDWGMVGAFQLVAGGLWRKSADEKRGIEIPDSHTAGGFFTVCTSSAIPYAAEPYIIADTIPSQLAGSLISKLYDIGPQLLSAAKAKAKGQEIESGVSAPAVLALLGAVTFLGYAGYQVWKRHS